MDALLERYALYWSSRFKFKTSGRGNTIVRWLERCGENSTKERKQEKVPRVVDLIIAL